MISLTTTSDVVTAVLAAPPATTQPSFVSAFADTPSSSVNGDAGAFNGTTAVNVVGSPASGVTRAVRMFSIYNADTAPVTVTVRGVVGGVAWSMCKVTLAVGSTLMYEGGIGLRVTDANGNFLENVQAQQSGSWTVSISGTPAVNLTNVGGSAVTLGQKTMAASVPVVIASDQSAIPVTGTFSSTTGVVSAANSTTTPLAAGGAFTGTSVSMLGYSNVEVIVYSDVASAANGLLIEFSSDGTNWDDSSPFTFTPGTAGPNQGQAFIAGVRAQFMRVVYTNGGTIQTTFRLQTVLKTNIIGGDVLSINGTVNDNNHGFLTVSQIVGKTTGGGGGYVPVKVNPSGSLTVENNMTQVGGSNITLGQKTSANSLPVVIASDNFGSTTYGQGLLSTTTPVNIGGNSAVRFIGIQVISVGATAATTPTSIQIKDGSGTLRATINVPTPSTALAPFEVINLVRLNFTLTNAGNPVSLTLGANLTAGTVIVNLTYSLV